MTKSTQSFSNLVQEQMRNVLQQKLNQQIDFSLDQAKTAQSSFSQQATNQSMQTPSPLSPYGTYVPKYINSYYRPLDKIPADRGISPTQPITSGAFQSCSAAMMYGMSGIYLNTRERREEFVVQLFNAHHNRKTIYFLPTSSQMKWKSKEESVLNLLFELGAVEVYTAPNNQPGHSLTNLMHLCVLNCGTDDFRERCLKYIAQVRTKDKYGAWIFTMVPRFVMEKHEELKEVPLKMLGSKNPPVKFPQQQVASVNPLGKPLATPIRDRLGRFMKKVTT